jgi:hypothetical protein
LGHPFSDASNGCLRLGPINSTGTGYEPCHWPAVPCDDDFFTSLNTVKQCAQHILGLKRLYFCHRVQLLNNLA